MVLLETLTVFVEGPSQSCSEGHWLKLSPCGTPTVNLNVLPINPLITNNAYMRQIIACAEVPKTHNASRTKAGTFTAFSAAVKEQQL